MEKREAKDSMLTADCGTEFHNSWSENVTSGTFHSVNTGNRSETRESTAHRGRHTQANPSRGRCATNQSQRRRRDTTSQSQRRRRDTTIQSQRRRRDTTSQSSQSGRGLSQNGCEESYVTNRPPPFFRGARREEKVQCWLVDERAEAPRRGLEEKPAESEVTPRCPTACTAPAVCNRRAAISTRLCFYLLGPSRSRCSCLRGEALQEFTLTRFSLQQLWKCSTSGCVPLI
ncbi:hypothetical protein MHYP_G00127460 [Metynnis hypsauchen]